MLNNHLHSLTIASKHKDLLFRLIFRNKHDILDLYNAMADTHYTDPEALQITTLEDVLYVGMENDLSFLLDNILNLWEHQSSFNPNMPVRGLLYFARTYRKYIEQNKLNIYSSQLKQLPFPQFIVFYNGLKEEPERLELKLSDAFAVTGIRTPLPEPCLEVKAIMLNINLGKNRELMDKCRRLKDYARFIASIRKNQSNGLNIETAVSVAIETCIADNVLEDILSVQRKEVVEMFLDEYDDQLFMSFAREEEREINRREGRAEGLAEGRAEGLAEGRAEGLRAFISDNLEEGTPENRILEKIRKHFSMSPEEALASYRQYSGTFSDT
ncbi:MAG: hypothetical protein SOZ59_02675 [Candidatus Limivivens sp.]|nr:hypothetical protein [Candidatus Limivivens sp.]